MPLTTYGVFDWIDAADRPLHQVYDERLALAALADELGFATYQVAEHHCTPLGLAPSPSVYLAAVARATSRIRIGPLVYLLPLYHPLRLVEEICMLDHLSKGRLELGVGRGVSPWELGHYGIDAAHSRELFHVALAKVVAGLQGDGTAFGRFDGAPIEIAPFQQPHPPLWYATTIPDSVRWAAEQGLNLAGLGPAGAYRPNIELFWSTWDAHRHDPGRLNAHVTRPVVALNRQVVVADTDAEALAAARRAHPRWAESFVRLWKAHGDDSFTTRTDFDAGLAAGTLVVGSPATVRAALDRAVEESGVDRILCAFAWGSLTAADVERSMRLFAAEVVSPGHPAPLAAADRAAAD